MLREAEMDQESSSSNPAQDPGRTAAARQHQNVWSSRSEGERCDGCDAILSKDQMLMEGVTMDLGRRPLQLHARCFQVWGHERRATWGWGSPADARSLRCTSPRTARNAMSTTILIIILVLILIGALPTWPYS